MRMKKRWTTKRQDRVVRCMEAIRWVIYEVEDGLNPMEHDRLLVRLNGLQDVVQKAITRERDGRVFRQGFRTPEVRV